MTGDPGGAPQIPSGPPQVIVQERRVGSGVGLAAIILGVLGIVFGIAFVPFGLLFALLAMFRGQVALGIVALLCNVFALVTSVWFWALLGISAGWTLFDWSWLPW